MNEPRRRSKTVAALIKAAQQAAASEPDLVATVIALIKRAVERGADPYLLAGALVEGVAHTVAARVPAERQGETAVEAVRMLRDRLRVHGAI